MKPNRSPVGGTDADQSPGMTGTAQIEALIAPELVWRSPLRRSRILMTQEARGFEIEADFLKQHIQQHGCQLLGSTRPVFIEKRSVFLTNISFVRRCQRWRCRGRH